MTQRTGNEDLKEIVKIKPEEEVDFFMEMEIFAQYNVCMIGQEISWTEQLIKYLEDYTNP